MTTDFCYLQATNDTSNETFPTKAQLCWIWYWYTIVSSWFESWLIRKSKLFLRSQPGQLDEPLDPFCLQKGHSSDSDRLQKETFPTNSLYTQEYHLTKTVRQVEYETESYVFLISLLIVQRSCRLINDTFPTKTTYPCIQHPMTSISLSKWFLDGSG